MRLLVVLALACAPKPLPTPEPATVTVSDPATDTATATDSDSDTSSDVDASSDVDTSSNFNPNSDLGTARRPPVGRRARPGTEAEVSFCVAETNRYRKLGGKPPFRRSSILDDFAREGARVDHRLGRPHEHFNTTRFPHPFSALAENQIPPGTSTPRPA